MDPITAVANAVSSVADGVSNIGDIFFGGRRRREQNQGSWGRPTDYAQDNTPYYVLGGLFILLIVFVIVLSLKNR